MSNAYYLNSSSSTAPKNDRERRQHFAPGDGEDLRASSGITDPGSREDDPAERGAFFSWNVRITPSAIITVGLLLAVLCSAIFFYGVFVGKSNQPIATPVELESLVTEEKVQPDEDNSQDILPKEELRFMSRLKREQTGSVLAEPEKNAPASGQAEASAPRADKPAEAKKPEPAPKAEEKPRDPQFNFVLRAATFNDRESAQKAAARLSKDGVRTRVTQVRSGKRTWHYVQVILKGSREDLKNTRGILARHGMKDAMVIKEQAVRKK